MTIERLIIGLALVTFNLLLSGTVRADELPAVNLPQLNTSSESSPGLGNSGYSPQTVRAAKHQLYLPSKTPLPLEWYRWPATHLKIYLSTRNQPLMTAFRDAVKAWNSTGVVYLTWTRHRCQADIIAETGDLSASQATPEVGVVTTQLGSTRSEYNPDTHALIQARSILDEPHLEYANRTFRSEVAQHELGHALGLAHAPQSSHSVMIPNNVRTGITKEDRQTIRLLYGSGD